MPEVTVAQLKAECDELRGRLHKVALAPVWRNEDGKKFVFVDDLAEALFDVPALLPRRIPKSPH